MFPVTDLAFLVVAGIIAQRSWGTPYTDEAEARRAGWLPANEHGQKVDLSNEQHLVRWSGHQIEEIIEDDAVRVTYIPQDRSLEEARQQALALINAQAKQRFDRYNDAVLRKARTDEPFLPSIQAALDDISATASTARQAVQDGMTVDEIAALFPVPWKA